MNNILIALFLTLAGVVSVSGQAMFPAEQQAQQHCPKDTVVWLNIPTGIYHMQGMRWYGVTNNGVYVCEKEVVAAGDRETRNGQWTKHSSGVKWTVWTFGEPLIK